MARVASCPQCEHDLLVPDDAEPSALVKCPQCRAFFELQHAESRELPSALVVESHPKPTMASTASIKSPISDDLSAQAALMADPEPFSKHELKLETGEADVASFSAQNSHEKPESDQRPASFREPRLTEEPQDFEPAGTESHEEAAQRIDQWFRSAKTLSDLPALEEGELAGHTSNEMLNSDTHVPGVAPINPASDDAELAEHESDLQLESAPIKPNQAAPWDDSQHMDRLLADFEGQPIDTYEPEGHEAATSAHEEQAHFQPASDWTPDESLSIPSTVGKPERKRSVVRTLVVSAFGGIVGLGLGYYALLWLGPALHRGREIDFLELAQYLPKSILPQTFQTEANQSADVPRSEMIGDLAASEKVVKPEQAAPPAAATPPAAADSTAQTPVAPAEKLATFTAPAEPAKKSADSDDRYAIPASKNEPVLREPAALGTPPAKAITESTSKTVPVRVNNAPSFSADEVSTSLAAATAAEAGLVTGNLQDSKEVARTKGASYVAIADFAQKATFADAGDGAKSLQPADEFFRKLLSDPHAREEVAQIVPRWLSHPKRPQNGVFFAGNVKHIDIPGSVVEYTVELSGGPSVVVVVPLIDKSESIGGPKGPVAVAGSIIDKPTDDIPGYTGKAPQVVFAKKLLPLD
jgi:hypothetical protein